MFITNTCNNPGCSQAALDGSELCLEHHPDLIGYTTNLKSVVLNSSEIFENRNWNGIDFSNIDMSGKQFRFCRFTGACFENAILDETQFYMCMLDNLIATDSSFKDARMESCIVVGSNLSNCNFTGSDIVNTNLNGIIGNSIIFNETDLESSCFVNANLADGQFRDCNLCRTNFFNAVLFKTDFLYSNTEFAYFSSGGLS